MKIIVTGSLGFIGTELVRELCAQGHSVISLIRSDTPSRQTFQNEKFVKVPCENFDEMTLEPADVFFHFAWDGTSGAARTDLSLQLKNVCYTQKAVELASRCGCERFVYAGSIMEYECIEYVPKDDTNPSMSYIYSTAKLTGDYIAKIFSQQLGMKYINTIISNVYGEDDNSNRFINMLVRKLSNNELVDLTLGEQLYDFIYSIDAAKEIALAGCYGKNGSYYYIGNEIQKPLKEYVELIRIISGSSSELKYGTIPFDGPYLKYTEFDTSKIRNEFPQFSSIEFETGIKRVIEKYNK